MFWIAQININLDFDIKGHVTFPRQWALSGFLMTGASAAGGPDPAGEYYAVPWGIKTQVVVEWRRSWSSAGQRCPFRDVGAPWRR